MKITIIGDGWVGTAMKQLFPDSYVYTHHQGTKGEANQGEIVFICVPTPVIGEGRLDTSIVEEIISWIACPLIVIRSTVNPGDCLKWQKKYHKSIVFQPEYIGESPAHPMLDPKTRPFLIIGADDPINARRLINLYQEVYNANISIRLVSTLGAEIIKLSENRAIAFKVAECQELYDVCEKAGIDYYVIRDAVYGDDPRFNLWWTFVYPNKRGFNSKCLPKDVYAWCAYAESLGYEPKITRTILRRNRGWINGKA